MKFVNNFSVNALILTFSVGYAIIHYMLLAKQIRAIDRECSETVMLVR